MARYIIRTMQKYDVKTTTLCLRLDHTTKLEAVLTAKSLGMSLSGLVTALLKQAANDRQVILRHNPEYRKRIYDEVRREDLNRYLTSIRPLLDDAEVY